MTSNVTDEEIKENDIDEDEIWKDYKGFSNYQVSNKYRVKNITTGKILKHNLIEKTVYMMSDEGKSQARVVAKMVKELFPPTIKEEIVTDSEGNIQKFVDVKSYEKKYYISNFGDAKSNNKLLTPQVRDGYYVINFHNPNKTRTTYSIHILVALHFVPNPDPQKYQIVDHIDGNKLNNKFNNLRWTDNSGNSLNKYNKYKDMVIIQSDLDGKFIKEWANCDAIVEELKYTQHTIRQCLNGKIKKAYDYLWKYKVEQVKKDTIILKEDEKFTNANTIDGYDFSNYDVTQYGTTRNTITGQILKPATSDHEYLRVFLKPKPINGVAQKGVNMKIHRLVANIFVKGRSDTKTHVNHIDENKLNNYYKNLEWVSNRENVIHTSGKKVNQLDIDTGKLIKTFDSIASAANEIKEQQNRGTSMCITRVCQGKKHTAYGYKWEYADKEKK